MVTLLNLEKSIAQLIDIPSIISSTDKSWDQSNCEVCRLV